MERRRLLLLVAYILVLSIHAQSNEINVDTRPVKLGRCPTLIDVNVDDCRQTNSSVCSSDYECPHDEKCCNDGCINVCTLPMYSACEHQLLAGDRRAREFSDPNVPSVKCKPNGEFETIQCDGNKNECWCINEAGFELPGTRVNSTEQVNCSAPRQCSGVMCRMLCPYDFALDEDGCPLCQCRDPCSGVKCPGSQKCHLEDVVCDSEPCPPIPSCKKARLLDSVCPEGEPLYLNEKSQPFLCGIEPNKPQCPPFFKCIVDDGMEYGACCPGLDNIEKPGKCPSKSENVTECGDPCADDTSCMGLLKCCKSDQCGEHCVPSNSTVCEQQRMLAELLSRNEKCDRGYVPECDEEGQFKIKQCSRNGLVCWCVDLTGNKIARTMGPAGNVSCSADLQSESLKCDAIMCQTFCEYGFKLDDHGCETCECADACDGFSCPDGERCFTIYNDSCTGSFCPSVPKCKAIIQTIHKPGVCPSIEVLGCVNSSSTCVSDDDCSGSLKCCQHACGRSCEANVVPPDRLPTMCEYLRAYALSADDSSTVSSIAYTIPECTKDGFYEPVQCDNEGCYCVDEFGVELRGTRGSTKDTVDCRSAQARGSCLGLMCRLGCDYGFVRDETGCPLCECRNPCDGAQCAEGLQCQLVDVEQACNGGFCPPVPKCVKNERSALECPSGEPIVNPDTSENWICRSDNDCPQDYSCSRDLGKLIGICCTKLDSTVCQLPKEPGFCEPSSRPNDESSLRWYYNNQTGRCESFIYSGCGQNLNNFVREEECDKICVVNVDNPPKQGTCSVTLDDEICNWINECTNDIDCPGSQKCCLSSCGSHSCRHTEESRRKIGQCPSLVANSTENCQLECRSDYDCDDDLKCCSNGCGMTCTEPELKTVCENLRDIGEREAKEKGIPPNEMFILSCSPSDGSFNRIQCIENKTCWCVNDGGAEIPGTRVEGREPESCPGIRNCPLIRCKTSCKSGMRLDHNGCPTCSCLDPCEELSCLENEECREVPVRCIDGPCPPVHMCLPKLGQLCDEGEPLRDITTRNVVRCGPGGDICPSTHKCSSLPSGAISVCCPKPRLSNCEYAREKNTRLMSMYNRNIFIPKCNSHSGAWEPMQCLPSLGLCWCVNKDGEQIPGTLVRGIPKCSVRTGRQYEDGNMTSPCENGKQLHVCNNSLCDNKICLRQQDAICRIDPCGGCSLKFYDESGHLINCEEGLTPCQLEMQTVMNSAAWANQENPVTAALSVAEPDVELVNFKELEKRAADNSLETTTEFISESVSLISIDEAASSLIGTTVPKCTNKGAYSPTQTSGSYSWCVTPHGEPIQSTMSRGEIQCSQNGSVIFRESESDEPLCPGKPWKPRVCKNECLDAYCTSHPEAICVADPCNNCKLSFFSPSGNPVSCEPKCKQPKIAGMCRASYRRYFFNESSNQCEEFIYGGCGGNDNNFRTMDECVKECGQPVNVCELPKRIGMCRASMHRWYFNPNSRKCEKFIFGGCDGNENNFETEEECNARCPDLILCPTLNYFEMQFPCSRRAVCHGITCPHNEDLICTVDPCNNCSIIFVDYDGIQTSCVPPSEENSTLEIETTEETTTIIHAAMPEIPDFPIIKRTRCEKERVLALAWLQRPPTCDSQGQFEAMQCLEPKNSVEELCWCVDEAGNRLPESKMFQKGVETCKPRVIQFVSVTLAFQHERGIDLSDRLVELRRAVRDILNRENAVTTDEIDITFTSEFVIIKFVLVGKRKVDIAFTLEEMVKYGMLKLQVADRDLPAIPEGSSFYHSLLIESDDYDETIWLSATTIGAILIFTVLTIVLVSALIGGVMVYRKRRMGTYPRGSLESLASSTSPLFAYDTKVPPHISCVEHDYAILNITEKKKPLE